MKQELQRITSATTKVRRLGYFVLFSRIIENTPLTPPSLQNRILEEEYQNHSYLEEACRKLHVNRKSSERVTGEIRSQGVSKGEDAFDRYLGTAIELGLLQEMSGRLYNTKRGEVLSALSEKDQNPFILSLAQKYWFLKVILEKDYDYFRTVLFCSIEWGPNEELRFVDMVQELWRSKLASGSFRSPETYDAIKKAIDTKWKSAKRYYLENIKAPRLEWFVDLGLIDYWNIRQNKVTVHDSLKVLLDSEEKSFSSLFVFHMKPFVNGSITYWRELRDRERDRWLEKFVVKSFDLFASDTLPRISVNQVTEYGLSVLAQSGVICENDEFESALKKSIEERSENYRYIRTISEADRGYISKL